MEAMIERLEEVVRKSCLDLNQEYVDPQYVMKKVRESLPYSIEENDLYKLASETAVYLSTAHPDYGLLAARITIDLLHRNTSNDFTRAMTTLYEYRSEHTNEHHPLINEEFYKFVMANADRINFEIKYERDLSFDYFAYKTLERSYLLKVHNKIVERPQHLFMRVALAIHIGDIEQAIKVYHQMSTKLYTHATPTLFNAGTRKQQMSSCFLLTMQEDSVEGIYNTLRQCALISQNAGGIGVAIHNVRAKGSFVRGTNGYSNGIIPMLRVFNDTALYIDQGSGKRKGAFCVYLEPWHQEIFEFLELKKNHGKEELRARHLFYALWINDLFMKRVESDGDWSLFDPNRVPELSDLWGSEFEELYLRYEKEGRAHRTVKARDLWFAIITAQIETGTPFMLYKDSANAKSNQQNLGTIKSSNLCTEIIQYTSPSEVAVCNLASIALSQFVNSDKTFNHEKLHLITKQVIVNLNKVIDLNYYPVPEAENSNRKHRPVGLGVQGLADVFIQIGVAFDSPEAKALNREIFETLYHASIESSMELAQIEGAYSSYHGSPISRGIFQFDMWGVKPSSRYDWESLREMVVQNGVRNSLLLAPMPTASTSQILGNNECIEPVTSNVYSRRVLAGEFPVINKYLVNDLIKLGLWNTKTKDKIIASNGSVQNIPDLPQNLKDVYKTVWEIKQRVVVEMAADRGAFICQSQSLNIHMEDVNFAKLSSLHFAAWKSGLKTGMYYLRTKAAVEATQFTIREEVEVVKRDNQSDLVCSLDNPEACEACGS